MAKIHDVIAPEMARLRYPSYSVGGGEGTLAVVLECCSKVVIVKTPMEAHALVNEKCGTNCRHGAQAWHRIDRIIRPEPERYRVIRNHPDRERD